MSSSKMSKTKSAALWEGQVLHVGVLVLSAAITAAVTSSDQHNNNANLFPTVSLLVHVILWTRILHQILITVIWRTELYCEPQYKLSTLVKSKHLALQITELIDVGYFMIGGNGMLALACFDYESMGKLQPNFGARLSIGIPCIIAAMWAIASGVIYLGPKRMAGSDHFYLPKGGDEMIRAGGAYSYVSHPIYFLGMLLDWGIAILAASQVCLWMSLSAHVSALAFLYGTEIPDMNHIYGSDCHQNNSIKKGRQLKK